MLRLERTHVLSGRRSTSARGWTRRSRVRSSGTSRLPERLLPRESAGRRRRRRSPSARTTRRRPAEAAAAGCGSHFRRRGDADPPAQARGQRGIPLRRLVKERCGCGPPGSWSARCGRRSVWTHPTTPEPTAAYPSSSLARGCSQASLGLECRPPSTNLSGVGAYTPRAGRGTGRSSSSASLIGTSSEAIGRQSAVRACATAAGTPPPEPALTR